MVSLAFAVQVVLWRPAITTFVNPFTSDVPSEALVFSFFNIKSWPKRTANEVKSWINPHGDLFAAVVS